MHYGLSAVLDRGLGVRRGLGLVVVVVNDDYNVSHDHQIWQLCWPCVAYWTIICLSSVCIQLFYAHVSVVLTSLVFLALSVPRFPCLVLLKLFGPASEILQRSLFSPCLIPTISPFQAFQMWTLFVSFISLSPLSVSLSFATSEWKPKHIKPNTSVCTSHHYTLDRVLIYIFTLHVYKLSSSSL